MKKVIYCINFCDDIGELWLDEDLKPFKFISNDDSIFPKDYEFIFKYLDVLFIHIFFETIEDHFEKQEKMPNPNIDMIGFWNLFKDDVKPLIQRRISEMYENLN